MKKYDKYKDSGIEWIGEIPEHWEVKKLGVVGKFSSSGIDKKTDPSEPLVKIINYTDVYGNSSYTLDGKTEYMVVSCPQSKVNSNLVKKGDLIFTPSSETQDEIGISALVIEDIENTAFSYHVLRFRFTEELDINFKKYLCNNHFVLYYFSRNAQGTTRQTLCRDDFKSAKVLIPPLLEQTAIATYLDRKTAEIDQLIEAKKRLIELYHEEKTAIINQAVTKGINPNAKMKDSGIEWLGEIPEHWEVSRMANFGKYSKGKGISKADITIEGVPVVLYGDIYTKYDIAAVHFERTTSLEIAKNSVIISKGDLLFTASGETEEDIGKCIVYLGDEKAYAGGDVIIYKQLENDSQFLSYLFNDYSFREQKAKLSKGEIVVHIYSSQLRDIKFPLPPLIEQQSIVHHIEAECSRIDTKIERTQRLIELLAEYRTALISEVVTGKVKVV